MNDPSFPYVCELIFAALLALVLLIRDHLAARLPWFLLRVGWHGPGDGS